MGEALLADVRGELVGELRVGQARAPGAEMHLVDAHRLARAARSVRAGVEPLVVAPHVVRLVDHRSRTRWHFGPAGHRVGLLLPRPVATEDPELVALADLGVRDVQLPDAGAAERPHRPAVVDAPAGEVADHADALRVRRPHGERGAADPRLRAEHRPQLARADPPRSGAGRGRRAWADAGTDRRTRRPSTSIR